MTTILYIANVRMPSERAHSTQIVMSCAALVERGMRVQLLVPRRLKRIRTDVFSYYRIAKTWPIRWLPTIDMVWLPFLKPLFFVVQRATFTMSVIGYLAIRKRDACVYTREIEVVYWAKKLGYPVIYEMHTLPSRVRPWVVGAWRACNVVVAISQGLKDDVMEYSVPAQRVAVIPDGVDWQQFAITVTIAQARQALDLPQDTPIIVYTGHLYAWKGVDTLAEAIRYVPDAQLYIVGGNELDVAAFKTRWPEDRLHVVGHRPIEEIPLWLRAAAVAVLPNTAKTPLSARHTSPLKLFEYMASGVPIIASDIPSLREVLDEKTACFFQPDNPQSLARAIQEVFANPSEAQQRAILAQERARNFDWSSRAQAIITELKRCTTT